MAKLWVTSRKTQDEHIRVCSWWVGRKCFHRYIIHDRSWYNFGHLDPISVGEDLYLPAVDNRGNPYWYKIA